MKRIAGLTILFLMVLGAGTAVAQPNNLDLRVDGIGAVSAPLQIVLLLRSCRRSS
jgi:hypothetical protein